MSQKIDRRYAADRNKVDQEKPAPMPYRAELLRIGKANKTISGGFRQMADETGLSVNTIRNAFAGQCIKLMDLWTLAQYFNIPWIAFFDLDRSLKVEVRKEPADFEGFRWRSYAGLAVTSVDLGKIITPDPATPETESTPAGRGRELADKRKAAKK